MKITPKHKKYITLASMILVGASNIKSPINLSAKLPGFLTDPLLGSYSVVTIASFALLVCAYWVFTKQID